jgi:hypothetical protein
MNLNKQFPDVSLQMRNQVKWAKKSHQQQRMSMGHLQDNDPELALFYDNEFKRWHYKLTLIIALGIAVLYGVIFTASGIYQWLLMSRNSYNL